MGEKPVPPPSAPVRIRLATGTLGGGFYAFGQAIAEISIVTDDNDEVELANEFLSHLLMEDTANYLRRGRAFESLSEGELEAEWLKAFRIVFYRDGNPADIVQLDDVAAEMRLRGMQAPDSYLLSEAEKQSWSAAHALWFSFNDRHTSKGFESPSSALSA